MTKDKSKFESVLQLIDEANAKDDRLEEFDGKMWAKELLYSHRMTDMLNRFCPGESELVQIACRAQHIERWKIPRSSYPLTREGYLKWRIGLYSFHANRVAELMTLAGYDTIAIEATKVMVGKKNIKSNPDTQTLEDVAGLVFLEHYMLDFAATKKDYSDDKWMGIIQKTWGKLSLTAREFALSGKLMLPEPLMPLIQKALSV